ncbi:hypothetical protein HDU93_000281 [Gonapodya sp. JEL0774]|nr:hypothetical protein HDU93_000281 [Gonapodya sp. JEL0774]
MRAVTAVVMGGLCRRAGVALCGRGAVLRVGRLGQERLHALQTHPHPLPHFNPVHALHPLQLSPFSTSPLPSHPTPQSPSHQSVSPHSPLPPPPNPTPLNSRLWVLANIAAAALLYAVIDHFRQPYQPLESHTANTSTTNAKDDSDREHAPPTPPPSILFVLGGPGAGKGTQCTNLVRDHGFVHLSAGDLLRDEQKRPGSPYGQLIDTYIKEGQVVPMEITIGLLRRAMAESVASASASASTGTSTPTPRFLIDGFPRAQDQADAFEAGVAPCRAVLYFQCTEAEMATRLLERGRTSGRADDKGEVLGKRFATFTKTSYPVIENYAKKGKVITDSVYHRTQLALAEAGIIEYSGDTGNLATTTNTDSAAAGQTARGGGVEGKGDAEEGAKSLLLPVAAGVLWGVGWVVAGRR